MLDCPDRKIIPIFYDTKSSDLRYIESGAYAHHFQEHKSKGRVEIQLVEKWIKTLNEVSHVSGLVYRNGTDDLGELLDSIVEDALKEVRRDELDLGEYPVGLHQAAERFQKEALDRTELSEVKVVGIVGLGGSGKSTLVAHLYNSKRSQFRRSCFLSDDESLFYYLMEPWEIRKKEPCSIEIWRREKGSLRMKMHDLVRDMARQIGREESPLRLCCSNDSNISTRVQSEPYRVQGIRRDGDHQLPVFLQHQDICALKLLAVQNSTLLRHFNSVSGELIWLRLCESDFNGIPSSLSLRNLRVLELSGVSPRDFQYLLNNCECPRQLHELTISCTGKYETTIQSQIPVLPPTSSEKSESTSQSSDFGKWFRQGLGNLVKLVLQNIEGFQSLPIEFEKLRNLRHLDLSGCSDLAALPDSFTKLLHLQYLALQGCRQLVLQDLGEISKLEYLSFEGCSSLAKLPRGTGLQNSLKYLNILHTQLEKLPEHLEQLENLKVMHIGSSKLTKFPSSLYNLDSLTDLTLIGCTNLFVIDKSFEQLLHLECFRVYSCGVKALPEGMVWMNIKFLDVQECPPESSQLLIGVEWEICHWMALANWPRKLFIAIG